MISKVKTSPCIGSAYVAVRTGKVGGGAAA